MKKSKDSCGNCFPMDPKTEIYALLLLIGAVMVLYGGNPSSIPAHHFFSANLEHQLIVPDHAGYCPPGCGCWRTLKDCPRQYSLDVVTKSAQNNDPDKLSIYKTQLAKSQEAAVAYCRFESKHKTSRIGGKWCLSPDPDGIMIDFNNNNNDKSTTYQIARNNSPPNANVVARLVDLFRGENVVSINDFGAGSAQYKWAITKKELPNIRYDAYDGAGNGAAYTNGIILQYIDLTVPLNLPVADWVISFEVGEHIPNKFEGMLIRNLHRHNKKGIILSWAPLGQGGHSHVNNHSQEYVVSLFESLGYKYDSDLSDKMREVKSNDFQDVFFSEKFTRSIYVFRRI